MVSKGVVVSTWGMWLTTAEAMLSSHIARRVASRSALRRTIATNAEKLSVKNANCNEQEGFKKVKLFVFDFDQTLSSIHVFKNLIGWHQTIKNVPHRIYLHIAKIICDAGKRNMQNTQKTYPK